MSIEEEQQVRRCLSEENFQAFRQDQVSFYGKLLSIFGLPTDSIDSRLFGNLALVMMMVHKAIPDTMPFLFPEVAEDMVEFQVRALVDEMERVKEDARQVKAGGGGGYGGIPGQGSGGRDGACKRGCAAGESRCIAVGSYVQTDTKDSRISLSTGPWKTGLWSVRPFYALRQPVQVTGCRRAFFIVRKEVA